MPRYRFVVTSVSAEQSREVLDEFHSSYGHEVVVSIPKQRTEEAMIELLKGAHAAIAGGDPYGRPVLESCPDLKVISRVGVGYDTIDLKAARELGIRVTTTPGTNDRAVADQTFALMLALSRRLLVNYRNTRAGRWTRSIGNDVGGKTLGIIGLGAIGRNVARRGLGFDMKVLAYDVVPALEFVKQYGIELIPLEELLRRSDFVTMHLPLTPVTRHLIDEQRLRLMKPTAYLINTARGPLIDEPALVKALQEGWIAGAGLDVFEQEPPAGDNPLFKLENVVVSPHIAGTTDGSGRAMTAMALKNALLILEGKEPLYEVVE